MYVWAVCTPRRGVQAYTYIVARKPRPAPDTKRGWKAAGKGKKKGKRKKG